MDRAYEANPASAAPTPPNPPLLGYPTEGGTPTTPGAWWFYMMTEELRAAVVAGGVTPDATKVNQLASAIQGLVTTGLNGYATQAWVTSQGYATQAYVNSQGFITAAALNGYATETWVGQQGFATTSYAANGANIVQNRNVLLQNLMLSGAVTLEADPGGTPANGTAGTIVAYF